MFPPGADEDTPVFVISVAAQLSGLHAQTLRSYDRLGLVSPGRASGGGRRYSARDIAVLREVQRLSQEEGVNLAGIKRIIDLENEVDALRAQAHGTDRGSGGGARGGRTGRGGGARVLPARPGAGAAADRTGGVEAAGKALGPARGDSGHGSPVLVIQDRVFSRS